ncbi:MAG TPA: SNF2-related protein [Pyrinomonadaceae bacterium]|nr:SNF2-related protein [Pyrinomonadaceae bacterium]
MSLSILLAHEFSSRIQVRGAQYFRNGVVRIVDHSRQSVDAIVRGSVNYFVRLRVDDSYLISACTCPYFSDGVACKHLWATILKVDRENYFPAIQRHDRLRITFDLGTVSELQAKAPANAPGKLKENIRPKPALNWQRQLKLLAGSTATPALQNIWPSNRQIIYLIDPQATRTRGRLTFEIGYRERNRKGDWGKFKPKRVPLSSISSMNDQADVQILSLLSGAKEYYYYSSFSHESLFSNCSLSPESETVLLPMMCSTGRCLLRAPEGISPLPIQWDDAARWELTLRVRSEASAKYELFPVLRNADEEIEVATALVITDASLITSDSRAGRLISRGTRSWVSMLANENALRVPLADADALVAQLLSMSNVPRLDLPAELRYEELNVSPTPHLRIRKPKNDFYSQSLNNSKLEADVLFDYDGVSINFFDLRPGAYDQQSKRFVKRDSEYEQAAIAVLTTLGIKPPNNEYAPAEEFNLAPKKLPHAVKTLLTEGWKVEAEGKLYRQAGSMNMSVSSGIDWFELHGEVQFGDGLTAKLPELLDALRRGESMVQLGDGSFGLMPEEWLSKYGLLTSLGETATDHLRFKRAQTGILDALLAAQPEVKTDETFGRILREWRDFKGITAMAPPTTFVGKLRPYQCDALGWFQFLERFGFGGCLADDMGLGKTVQVLALLESRRVARQKLRKSSKSKPSQSDASVSITRPSLVVMPRSLIFNWEQEAARFTPKIKILKHTGAERIRGIAHFDDYDLILTTYGTLRRDAVEFHGAHFDYVILDESQAIKNAKTESAKAVRLLDGANRLALSGTPIENHIGEVWSLFEFLNPGMLGAASVFQLFGGAGRTPNEETRRLLSRALRPFFLRRTKEQVATELPEKVEQTIFCEMEAVQRRQYNELREHYRKSLLAQVEETGLGRAKIQVLEALLRLRQAACHPALLGLENETSFNAKLDVLMPRLSEIIEEGHKALVFSQFTSFLGIVRRKLELEGIDYEYLDGKTRDRAAKVHRFQNDSQCRLFLISLRAGGQGLNLTAADYVFLLDPWWNPAVEAQAIDRTHRIGQAKRVFAYRLITRDTVEEKVLLLQADKRELADAIINEDNSLIKTLTSEELLLLLS